MKKYIKLIVAVGLFILAMVGVNVLYTGLAEDYAPETEFLSSAQGEQGQTEEVSDTESGQVVEEQAAGELQEDAQAENQQAVAENMAIDFTVENAEGEEVTLYSFVGKPIVLNFWASWCGPCKMELPDFQSAYEKYGEEVEFLLVNMTDGMQETKETAAAFMESEGYTLPVYYDTMQEAAYAYQVYSIPTTYLIDTNGVVVAKASGMLSAEALEEGISMIY